jgi:predicted protein tyrosine phosphatase
LPFKLIRKVGGIITRRFRRQGVKTTLLWFYARGLPFMTGVPMVRYSQITPDVFIGPQYRRAGKRRLEKLGVTGGVNMRIEFDDAAQNLALARYCYLPTIDDDAPTLEHLEEGIEFIQQVISEGGKVYIHCAGGIGRAPTMAAAYFVSQGHSLDEAINLIKKSRPFISITPVQLEQLRKFERAYGRNGHNLNG